MKVFFAGILFASLLSCAVVEPAPTSSAPRDAARLLVKPRPGVTLETFDEILSRYGAKRIDLIAQINVHVVEVAPEANARDVALKLKNHPEVEAVEIDERLPPSVRSSTPQTK